MQPLAPSCERRRCMAQPQCGVARVDDSSRLRLGGRSPTSTPFRRTDLELGTQPRSGPPVLVLRSGPPPLRRSSMCIAGRFGAGRGSPFCTGGGYIFASSSSSLSASTSDQLVIFARSARLTTCVVVPRPTASVFAISRWLRPSTHFSRRISRVFRMDSCFVGTGTPHGAPTKHRLHRGVRRRPRGVQRGPSL